MKYTLLSGLGIRGEIYPAGAEVELTPEEAEPLMNAGYPILLPVVEGGPSAAAQQDAIDIVIAAAGVVPPDLTPAPGAERPNLNTIGLDELIALFDSVNGIGKGSAAAIIENRPYSTLEEVPDKADLVGIARASWPDAATLLTL